MKEKQKLEAVKRMKMLNLMPQIIKEFEDSDKLEYSEQTRLGGILYWIDNHPDWTEKIRNFEKEHGAIVYHAIHNRMEFGEILNLLYVSKDEYEWELDREELKRGEPLAYVMDLSQDLFSEFGSIGVKPAVGGLVRIW